MSGVTQVLGLGREILKLLPRDAGSHGAERGPRSQVMPLEDTRGYIQVFGVLFPGNIQERGA